MFYQRFSSARIHLYFVFMAIYYSELSGKNIFQIAYIEAYHSFIDDITSPKRVEDIIIKHHRNGEKKLRWKRSLWSILFNQNAHKPAYAATNNSI